MPGFRDVLIRRDKLPYVAWRLFGKKPITLRLQTRDSITMRPLPASDLGVAADLFLCEAYKPPRPLGDVKHIVDLGANVGYSVVYFARLFPGACIEAFEPHPAYVRQLAEIVALNSLQDRVSIYPVAAGCRDEDLFLSDAEFRSAIKGSGSIPVKVIDWLAFAVSMKIDLLKVDIEGSEYDLFMDPRFASLRIPYIVAEWHASPDRPNADAEIISKLTADGYEVLRCSEGADPVLHRRIGTIWAFFNSPDTPA